MKASLQGSLWRPLIPTYGVAVLSVAAAVALLSFMPFRWPAGAHVSLFLLAVIVGSRFGGDRPGLAAIALSILAYDFFFLPPVHSLRVDSGRVPDLLLLAVLAAVLWWLIAARSASLRRAVEARRRADELFRAIVEDQSEMIVRWKPDGTCTFVNQAYCRASGKPYAELVGTSFRPRERERIEALTPASPYSSGVHESLLPDGSTAWTEWIDRAFFDEQGRLTELQSVGRDITERKRADDELRESRELLRLVLATLPVGVVVTDREGDIIIANAVAKRIWGGELIVSGAERRARIRGFWHDSGRRLAPEEWGGARALAGGETSLNELIDIDAADGRRKTIQHSAAPVRDNQGQIVGSVVVNEDVTERVCAAEAVRDSARQLQHLSRRLLAVQEEERRHLSREMHDEFGQVLASIALHLHAAKALAGPDARPSLVESIALLQRAGEQMRHLALELRPTMLEAAGLDATLRWLAAQARQRSGIATEVAGHVDNVPGDLAIACFRVVQEALTNIVRHAQARHVRIELSQSEGELQAVVRDDGVGFDVAGALERAAGLGHLGLLGMKERVQILGGSLEFESAPGQGTRIRISLPLSEAMAETAEPAA